MTTVENRVPNLENLVLKAVEETRIATILEIEATAKQNAPVYTGFYRNNIKSDIIASEVVANADYSAPIEYGVSGTARQPNPVMRNAARAVQEKVSSIFERFFK